MKNYNRSLFTMLSSVLILSSCDFEDVPVVDSAEENGSRVSNNIGAVYAMANGNGQIPGNVQDDNAIVAYGRGEDGTLSALGVFATAGKGGDFDGGEGLDPLISAYALTKTDDNQQLLAVNAGSNTITSFNINEDYTLELAGNPQPTGAEGPNSLDYTTVFGLDRDGVKGIVYVSNISRPEFLAGGEPEQQGTITGFRLKEDGTLESIPGSTRNLATRPSAVQFSPDGRFLVVASINSGAAGLASGSEDEIVVYGVNSDGTLSGSPTGAGTSTLRGNAEGRNLPSAIGIQVVGDNYVVVTEAREFQSDGTPPAFPALQDGSVSTWQITPAGSLTPISQDVRSGEGNTGRTACWLDFTLDGNTFFVSNAIEAGLASFSFNSGVVTLLDQVAAQGTGATGNTTDPAAAFDTTDGWIDMWISDDGQYLYQLYGLDGTIGVYKINGQSLQFVEEVTGSLPDTNTQGIVAI